MTADSAVLVLDDEAPDYEQSLRQHFPGRRFEFATTSREAIPLAGTCDAIIVRPRLFSDEVIAAATRLSWLQSLTAGVDRLRNRTGLASDVVITSARGAHSGAMAELVLMLMMALSRKFQTMLENQRVRRWKKWPQPSLAGKTAVVLGLGVSARAFAERCGPFGLRLVGVSSTHTNVPGFECVVPRSKFKDVVAEADFVVCLATYTDETHHIVDDTILAKMKPTAYLINPSRGAIVDEAALISALSSGRIAGAGLDVVETEPLPADSPLWGMENVIVTPHIGGVMEDYPGRVMPILLRNLAAFFDGRMADLENIVTE